MSAGIITIAGREGGHWYNRDGLVSGVPSADGKRTITRITSAHARKFGLVPSTTTILKIIDKPNLTAWKCREFVRAAGYVGAQKDGETFEQYFSRVSEQFDRYNDHAAVGTDIHAQIAQWAEGREYDAIADKAVAWLCRMRDELIAKYGHVDIESEKPFASDLGFGGTVDFKFITSGEVVFIDFKSTDDDKLAQGARLAYRDSHLTQLVAYDMGTNINALEADRRYINIFIGRLGGEIYVHEWTDAADVEWAREYFKAALKLFNIAKGLN